MKDVKEQVLSYIKEKGWTYTSVDSEKGIQLSLKVCPYCRDDKGGHFYIALETGQNYCHSCGEKGGLYTLKKFLGDVMPIKSFQDIAPTIEEPPDDTGDMMLEVEKHQTELVVDREALKYLHSRRFSFEAIRHFKLGVEHSTVSWLWYPYLFHGMVKNVKMRSLPPADKAFKRWKGGESSLFNEDVLDEDYDTIIITEGESDCIALWSKGVRNVIGVTVGAKGIKNEWITKLDKYQRIYLAYDSDVVGKSGAAKFATRLGLERCFSISIPSGSKDINDFFIQGGTREVWDKLVSRAAQFDVENIQSLSSVLQDSLIKQSLQEKDAGLDFPWSNVSRLAGKMQPGDLWIITSKPKVGKTTFSLNIMYNLVKQDIPSLLFELEMRPERMLPRIIALHLHKNSTELNYEDFSKAYNEMRGFPFYFAYGYSRLDWPTISDTIRMCIRRYGIHFVVFDNLHFLGRSKDHMVQEISIMTQNFKLLAEELAIPILLIARPKKTGGKEMTTEDLAWSADIEADADAVIILDRHEKKIGKTRETVEGVFEPETKVRVSRIRYQAGGQTTLMCVDAEARFDMQ